jgi:hypothetical protein
MSLYVRCQKKIELHSSINSIEDGRDKENQKLSLDNSNECNKEESTESDYDECEDQLEEKAGEITVNQVF